MGRFDRRHRFAMWCLRWAVLAALWLALTDTRAFPELATGAVAAAIAATVAGLVTRVGPPRTVSKSVALLRVGPRRLTQPLVRLLLDTGLLASALWRRLVLRQPVHGSFRAARHREEVARRSAAGRALTEAWGSLPPNRYVVGIDEADGLILVHELVRSGRPLDPLGEA